MINEIHKIHLGGEDQWYTVRGMSASLPILLFLHGGPGSPQTGAQHKYNRKLEVAYLVVNWDQRGGGKSYHPLIDPATMTVDQLVSDAYELVQHLLNKYNQQRIFIMGHSMGAILGMKFIHRYPEVVHAYIGINQPVDRPSEEERTQQFVFKEAVRRNQRKAIDAIKQMEPPVKGSFASTDDLVLQRTWLTKFGGVTYKKNAVRFNLSYILSSHLTWKERIRFMKGFAFSSRTLWAELNATNLMDIIPEVKVPVYFIMGRHDKIVHHTIENYYEMISAPYKELIVFEESGHFACFEEAERFNDLMIHKVLREVDPTNGQLAS